MNVSCVENVVIRDPIFVIVNKHEALEDRIPVKSEFRDMDRTNRCRITRSTFSSTEVGSDSLILGVGAALLC